MKLLSIAAAALALVASIGAHATTTNLVPAIVGSPLSFGGFATPGLFNDVFTFTMPTNGGSGYSVTNFTLLPGQFNTALSALSLVSNANGILNDFDDTTLTTSFTPGGNSLSMAWLAVPAGNYYITVTGTANGAQGGIYNGAISVSPVPEPETLAMMLAGLGAVGFIAMRRRRD